MFFQSEKFRKDTFVDIITLNKLNQSLRMFNLFKKTTNKVSRRK